MPFYVVQYAVKEHGEYIYPEATKGVVWKQAVYHHEKSSMIGETVDEIGASGKDLVKVSPEKAKELIAAYRASYPKQESDAGLPD